MEVIFVSSDGSPDELMKFFKVWPPSHFYLTLWRTKYNFYFGVLRGNMSSFCSYTKKLKMK